MTIQTSRLLLPLLLPLLCHAVSAPLSLHTQVEEESALRSTVANVWQLAKERKSASRPKLKLVPLNDFFELDTEGNIRVRQRIDREGAAGDTQRLTVFDESNTIFGYVNISIQDINDNTPKFPKEELLLEVEENDAQFRAPLDPATDPDAGRNGMISGSHTLESDAGTFMLEKKDGFLNLGLRPDASVDFEQVRSFELQLRACDDGVVRRCASQRIVVNVCDRNDHAPNVSRLVSLQVNESFRIGDVVGYVVASDRDSGDFGRVRFRVENHADVFYVDSDGRVRLRRRLNAEKRDRYDVRISVRDGGQPPLVKHVRLEVNVVDINDHEPSVGVAAIHGSISVVENNKAEGPLALLDVTDGDKGDNAKVTCRLLNDIGGSFRLQNSGKDYLLYADSTFDCEVQGRTLRPLVQCQDGGQPSLVTNVTIEVDIIDVNEETPTFVGVSKFVTSVSEAAAPGHRLLTLTAQDKDCGGRLSFSILPNASYSSLFRIRNQSSNFKIDLGSTVGSATLEVATQLDRETLPRQPLLLTLLVSDAADSAGTRRWGSATVTLTVQDENDNAPRLVEKSVVVVENCQPDQEVARLRHVDPDEGLNAETTFSLESMRAVEADAVDSDTSATTLDSSQWPLTVRSDGRVVCVGGLDRERWRRLLLRVQLANSRAALRLTTIEDFVVRVGDVDDNRPVWTSRSPLVVNVNDRLVSSQRIAQVVARDPDADANVTYQLVDTSSYFAVDAVSGDLLTRRRPPPGLHRLRLRATGASSAVAMFADTELVVNVSRSPMRGLERLREADINVAVIMAMVVVTGVVSVGLVAAIVCVRRRGVSNSMADECGEHDGSGDCGGGCDCDGKDGGHQGHHLPMYGATYFDPSAVSLTTFATAGNGHLLCHEQQIRQEYPVGHGDLDGDSADSGRGGSEDGHNAARLLAAAMPRRLTSPPPRMRSPCHCLGIPEEEQQQQQQELQELQLQLGQPHEENSMAGSFLPPPVPPHGVQYVGWGHSQQRVQLRGQFATLDSLQPDSEQLC